MMILFAHLQTLFLCACAAVISSASAFILPEAASTHGHDTIRSCTSHHAKLTARRTSTELFAAKFEHGMDRRTAIAATLMGPFCFLSHVPSATAVGDSDSSSLSSMVKIGSVDPDAQVSATTGIFNGDTVAPPPSLNSLVNQGSIEHTHTVASIQDSPYGTPQSLSSMINDGSVKISTNTVASVSDTARTDHPPTLSELVESASFKSRSTPYAISNPNPRAIVTIRIDSPRKYAGLELYDVVIGTPAKNAVAVRSVRPDGEGAKCGAERGMILLDYSEAKDVVRRIAGPYPIELRLYNLALGGDGVGDLGQSIVSAEDALEMAAKTSSGGALDQKTFGNLGTFGRGKEEDNNDSASASARQGLVIDTVRQAKGKCGIKSRRGDTMEIRYEARLGDRFGPIYDSSDMRGTGTPYAYMLGNNDVIRGVDLGTYDMCPGEVRELTIPSELAYGPRGSRLFRQIGPDATLWWRVELVALNFVQEGNNDSPRDELYEGLTRPP